MTRETLENLIGGLALFVLLFAALSFGG